MSTVYNEGPYKNWTGINFPTGNYYVDIFADSTLSRGLTIRRGTGGVFDPGPFDASVFQAVLQGAQSGASIDLSALPIVGSGPSFTFPVVYPGCANPPTGLYAYPSGALITTSGPFIGACIVERATSSFVQVYSRGSWTESGTSCTPDLNAPALPAWIDLETINLV